MKTESTVDIPVFQNLGTNRYYYHFNHSSRISEEEGEKTVINMADTVVMAGIPTKEKIEKALVSKVTDKGDINPIQYKVNVLKIDEALVKIKEPIKKEIIKK